MAVESPKPVVTVEVNSRTKTEQSFAQLEVNLATTARKSVILQNIADLNLRTVEVSDKSTKRKVLIIFKTRTMNFFLLSTQARKKSKCILGYDSSSSLGLIIFNINTLNPVQQDHDVRRIINKHPKLFEGTGNLKGREVKLEIDPTITPVTQTNRKIPHSMKTKVNKKLQEMREEEIIEKVGGSNAWLSPLIAIPKKSGDLRLVLDMRIPNTVNEILQKMEGAKVFTEVDLSQDYLQLTLAEESRHITAFSTPEDGPHRFTRLIMGASPSGEHFREISHELIKDVPDCANISDNIWLWSKNREIHLKRLDQLLTILRTNGITLKLPKCSFAMKLEEIQRETLAYPQLQQIKQNLQNNQVYKLPKAYKLIAQELCITDQDILLRADRIVLPNKLRQQAISLAHEDHAEPATRANGTNHTKLPKKLWSKLAIDVCGPFTTGEQVVVLTDYYSRWPEVKILKSVTSKNILDWLLSVFATHGFPDKIKSDNASYFVSTEFKDTLTSWGIEHKTVTEYWPQANGQVERFNQVLEKHILTAQAEGKEWKPTIPFMLLHYRNTPHRMTGRTPSHC
ncbi:Retrovirus-related Pol poly [Paramuricea clavata]|uniref:Retrovirus-related Pol poly n=1 Tax=Paramuricea clavata TaxID=317549 RepID=A0A6S7LJ14_PARCT|nr:Retrovirus-related Pol poly [Paramuricea clavata]